MFNDVTFLLLTKILCVIPIPINLKICIVTAGTGTKCTEINLKETLITILLILETTLEVLNEFILGPNHLV